MSSARQNSRDVPSKRADDACGDIPKSRVAIFLLIAATGCAADLLTKHFVFSWRGGPREGNIWWVVEDFIGIETALNHGALFGIGQGKVAFFSLLSFAFAIGIPVWLFYGKAARDKFLTFTLALVMGGILGNLYDRLGFGFHSPIGEPIYAVRDWIRLSYHSRVWPNFNIADSLLVVGGCLLALHALFQRETPEVKSENVGGKSTSSD